MQIELTRGHRATVSPEDFEFLSQWKWHYMTLGYAGRNARKADDRRTMVYMHRAILERYTQEPFAHSDHINRDRLDNRRENLRPATHAENLHNTGPQRNNKSGVKNVHWDHGKWVACIQRQGHKIELGRFDNLESAAAAVQKAVEVAA